MRACARGGNSTAGEKSNVGRIEKEGKNKNKKQQNTLTLGARGFTYTPQPTLRRGIRVAAAVAQASAAPDAGWLPHSSATPHSA